MRWPFKDKRIEWSEEKNRELLHSRGVSFNDVALAIEKDEIIDILPHWNKGRFGHQEIIVLELNGYIHVVPCVVDNEKVFLKTIFAHRDVAKRYLLDNEDQL
ncbi:toxin [Candidatus Kaiserbacteria bacterium]|nr:toxin [Candidatus Kaiserbacteria bacterium]